MRKENWIRRWFLFNTGGEALAMTTMLTALVLLGVLAVLLAIRVIPKDEPAGMRYILLACGIALVYWLVHRLVSRTFITTTAQFKDANCVVVYHFDQTHSSGDRVWAKKKDVLGLKLPKFSGNAFSFEITIWDIRFVLKAITAENPKANDPLRGFKPDELLLASKHRGMCDVSAILTGDFVTAMMDSDSVQKAIVANRPNEFKSIVAVHGVLDKVLLEKENWRFSNILWTEVTMIPERPMCSYFPSKSIAHDS